MMPLVQKKASSISQATHININITPNLNGPIYQGTGVSGSVVEHL